MSQFESVLSEFVNAATQRAGLLGASSLSPTPLMQALGRLRKRSDRYLNIAVAMILILFIVEIAVVVSQASKPAIVTGAVAGFGVSASGLIVFMGKLWRDRDRMDTILAIADSLDPGALAAVLQTMLETYFPRRRTPR